MFQQEDWAKKWGVDFMSMTREYETLDFESREKIVQLTINRPKQLNALNSKVLSELKQFLHDLKKKPSGEITGLIFTGSGEKAFIAGADIKEMQCMNGDEAKSFASLGQEVTFLFESLPFPVISCVNGFALGGGCEMALSGDFIYSTETAVFGLPEVKLGLIPGFGGTQRLAKIVGRNRAKELVYTGKNIKAAQAHEMGLVSHIFRSKEEMLAAAEKTLLEVGANSPLAVSVAKSVMNCANDLPLREGLEEELKQFAHIFSSEDMKEGTTAFVEKRKAEFKGY
jgi:enoyl-CoA hydratase